MTARVFVVRVQAEKERENGTVPGQVDTIVRFTYEEVMQTTSFTQ